MSRVAHEDAFRRAWERAVVGAACALNGRNPLRAQESGEEAAFPFCELC